MFVIKILRKIIKALGSESSPNQLAFGFAMGMILGFTPFWNIHNLILIFIIALVRVNISAVLLGGLVFSLLGPLFDGLFHALGLKILQMSALQGLWEQMYNNNFWVLTGFNNTILMGSFVVSLILFIPVFFGFRAFSKFYKVKLHPRVQKWKITKFFKGTKIFKLLNTGYKLNR